MSLKGKRILALLPVFHQYSDYIVRELKDLGAEVDYFENKMFPSDWRCSIDRWRGLYKRARLGNEKNLYINKILKETNQKQYDYFLAINGFCITKDLIKGIRNNSPHVKCILYLWDSLIYWRYSNIIPLFDIAYSFDHEDCKKYSNLRYHPNFIVNDTHASTNKESSQYDVVHIGSINRFCSHRIEILSKIKSKLEEQNISHYIKIYYNDIHLRQNLRNHFSKCISILLSPNERRFQRIVKKYKNCDIFTNQIIPYSKVVELESNAKAIIDIPLEKQNGNTLRSLETIYRGKILYTTNKSILEDSFYNPQTIFIIGKDTTPNFSLINSMNGERNANISQLLLPNWLTSIFSIQ